ncbi:MAG: hypothetical protein ACRCSC_05090, partial [Lactococcus garvieae]
MISPLKKIWNSVRNAHKLLAILFLLACGPDYDSHGEFYSLFFSENAKTPSNFVHFHLTSGFLYWGEPFTETTENDSLDFSIEENANIQTWKAYFKNKYSEKQIYDLIYSQDTKKLITTISNNFSAAKRYLSLTADIDTLMESNGDYWAYNAKIDTNFAVGSLFSKELYKRINAEKDPFLKSRYQYQQIKVLDFMGDYKGIVDLVEKTKNKNPKDLMYQWQLCRAAGAYKDLRDTATSVLKFAEVFSISPSKKYTAVFSVRRVAPVHFENAFKRANDSNIKAAILALKAIHTYDFDFESLEKLNEIVPDHELLEQLFAREVNKSELKIYPLNNSSDFILENRKDDIL